MLGGKIGIVAHDAGAANHIFAWLDSGFIDSRRAIFCLAGPAEKIYRKKLPEFINYSQDVLLAQVEQLISGTSWPSDFEYSVRKMAYTLRIQTIAVIDHWTHYPERFTKEDTISLPDSIWVSDPHAQLLARQYFPDTPVILQENHFLSQQVKAVEVIQSERQDTHCGIKNILFVMEPVPTAWNKHPLPSELQALEYFLLSLLGKCYLRQHLSLTGRAQLIIKPHPSDKPGKYDKWLRNYKTSPLFKGQSILPDIKVDEYASLSELIAWSDVVVGCQTYAMIVALAAGRQVISALPDDAPPCVLPHDDIIHLRQKGMMSL